MQLANSLPVQTNKLAHRPQLKRIQFLQNKAYCDFAKYRIAVRDVAALAYTVIRLGLSGFLEFQEAIPGHLLRLTGREYSPFQIRSAINTLCEDGYLTKPRKQDPAARLAKPYFITDKLIERLDTGFQPRVIEGGKLSHNSLRSEPPTTTNCTKDNQSLSNSGVSSSFVKNTIRARKDNIKSETSSPRKKSKPAILKNDTRTNIKAILWWISRCRSVSGQTEAAILQGRFAEISGRAGNRFEFWIHRWTRATGSEKSYFTRQIVEILKSECPGPGADESPVSVDKIHSDEKRPQDSDCKTHESNSNLPICYTQNNEGTQAKLNNADGENVDELRHAMLFHGEYSGPHQFELARYRAAGEFEKRSILRSMRSTRPYAEQEL